MTMMERGICCMKLNIFSLWCTTTSRATRNKGGLVVQTTQHTNHLWNVKTSQLDNGGRVWANDLCRFLYTWRNNKKSQNTIPFYRHTQKDGKMEVHPVRTGRRRYTLEHTNSQPIAYHKQHSMSISVSICTITAITTAELGQLPRIWK